MKKTAHLNLAGKNYPLNFSLGACKVIAKELGGIEKPRGACRRGAE